MKKKKKSKARSDLKICILLSADFDINQENQITQHLGRSSLYNHIHHMVSTFWMDWILFYI
ncbi:hypothetical protein DERF_001888 [Dermatophagoides farinae]|uniref:Uncharacterized protein n=1 Tax=Dermatophagoides farinae TaxID=6954 RepID=A0A922IAF8_DERFA|nr:hypothetical protein DERF_001888 [Dermatophagoides farinae]